MWLKLGMSNGGTTGVYGMDRWLGRSLRRIFDWLFPRDLREEKVVEFINLRQGGMSVLEYFLKFTKYSKCAPYLVSDHRDESYFVSGVLDDCKMGVIHLWYMEIWIFLVSWIMIDKWKRQCLRRRVEMLRGQDLLMVILEGVGLISKTS